jgi:hypothetical protein
MYSNYGGRYFKRFWLARFSARDTITEIRKGRGGRGAWKREDFLIASSEF